MGNSGFDTKFYIRRKRTAYALQFLAYLDGFLSAASQWLDKEDTDVDAAATNADLAPLGYLTDGTAYLTDNMALNGVTVTEFTIAVVLSRDENSNNEGILYGLFGSTHYPRIYFTGTTLTAQVKLDGAVKTITVSNVDTYLQKGKPHFIVLRGSNTAGIELLIDGVSRGTQTDTGTAFDTGSGDFYIAKDTNLSYFQKGAVRGVFVIATRLTDAQLSTWRTMLAYEGYFDLWRDHFSKWTGSNTFSGGNPQIANSPYAATIVES
jgi:hypothetical protein